MIPTVRGVILASISLGSILKVSLSVSQKITLPPACVIVSDVEIQECAVVMTSSPGLTPSARIAIYNVVGAIRARDTMFDTHGIGPSALKSVHMTTADKGRLGNHAGDSVVNSRFNANVL